MAWLTLSAALTHLGLVCLILRKCVLALPMTTLLAAIVLSVPLRVASIILTIGLTLNTVLEATGLRWTEGICAARRTEVLLLCRVLVVVLLVPALLITLLRWVTTAVALLRNLTAVLVAAVLIVRAAHGGCEEDVVDAMGCFKNVS